MKEDIRQKIIFTEYQDKYLVYVTAFRTQCLPIFIKNNYVEDCAQTLMNSIGINSTKVQKAVDAFVGSCSGEVYESLMLDRNRFNQLGYYPALIINRSPVLIL